MMTKLTEEHCLVKHFFINEQLLIYGVGAVLKVVHQNCLYELGEGIQEMTGGWPRPTLSFIRNHQAGGEHNATI